MKFAVWIWMLLLIWSCKTSESASFMPFSQPVDVEAFRLDSSGYADALPQNFEIHGFRSTKEGQPRFRPMPDSHSRALAEGKQLRRKALIPWRVQAPQSAQTAAVVFGVLALIIGIAAMIGGFLMFIMGVMVLAGGDASSLWKWGFWLTLTAGTGVVLSILNLAFSYAKLTGSEGLGWAALGMNLGAITIGILVLLLAPKGE